MKPRSRVLRGIYFTLGLICLGLVFLSALPGIPTYDPLILAAFFFSKSSDRFHSWLINHPVFGRIIRGYQAGLPARMKLAATTGIVLSLGASAVFLTDSRGLRTVLALVGVVAVSYVWTRPSPEQVTARNSAIEAAAVEAASG